MTILETSYLIDLMRGREEAVAVLHDLEARGEALNVSAVAVFELYRGLHRSRLPDVEQGKIRAVLAARPVAALDGESARLGGTVDGLLAARGQAIDPEDAMIAGIAISRGERLLTGNQKHFSRVEGLDLVPYRE